MQFFCQICALGVGQVEHLRFSTIFRVREAYSVTKMVNKHILQPMVRDGDILRLDINTASSMTQWIEKPQC